VVGLAVGSVFGLMALSTYNHALQTECVGTDKPVCTPQGLTDRATASTQADTATIAFIVGGVLTAGGAALFFTTPAGSVSIGPTMGSRQGDLGAGIGLHGQF
jgi:hypothetical protein